MVILALGRVIRTKHYKMDKYIKIALAVLMFGCLLNMPYGYYQLLRFLALLGFLILAFQESQKSNHIGMVIYIALALLFQPFLKLSLGRELWNLVDIIVGVGLLISAFKKSEK